MQVLLESKLVNLVVVNVKFNVGFKKNMFITLNIGVVKSC